MKIKILGSAGLYGVPVAFCQCKVCTKAVKADKRNIRTRASLLVESDKKKIVIDCGLDFREQMLREKLKKIDYLLLTHRHSDHTSSLGELMATGNFYLETPKEVYEDLQERRKVFTHIKMRNPKVKCRHFKPKKIGNLKVDCVKVRHIKIKAFDLPTYGYIFQEGDKKIAYIPDVEALIDTDLLQDLDILFIDGSYFRKGFGHVGITGGIKIFKRLKPKLMIFTHLNHYKSHADIQKYVSKFGNIKVAYDGMEIKI